MNKALSIIELMIVIAIITIIILMIFNVISNHKEQTTKDVRQELFDEKPTWLKEPCIYISKKIFEGKEYIIFYNTNGNFFVIPNGTIQTTQIEKN